MELLERKFEVMGCEYEDTFIVLEIMCLFVLGCGC